MSWQDWPVYSAECRADVAALLAGGGSLTAYRANPNYGAGPAEGSWAWKLEREAELVHSVRHVIACSSGTVALMTLLWALAKAVGEIITTSFTFSATVTAIIGSRHKPVFADVETPTGSLDPYSVARMRTERTVEVLPVDLFGYQARPFKVVDACQSVGLPPHASHGAWSFNGRKNVPAGEGGAIFTDDDAVAEQVRFFINHEENFGSSWVSGNGRMPELTACVAYHGMRAVRSRNAIRQQRARVLNELLGGCDVITPNPDNHALYMYPLVLPRGMPEVAARLRQLGVICQPGYIQPPLHQYRAFSNYRRDALPNTESLSRDRLLLFPQVTPTATEDEMLTLGKQIIQCL